MEKYSLTDDGCTALQQILYGLGVEELQAEAESLAADPCAWIARHFELEVRQLEYLRNVREGFMLLFGWSAAAAVISRRPVRLSQSKEAGSKESLDQSCILYNFSLSGHFSKETLFSSGRLQIKYTKAI